MNKILTGIILILSLQGFSYGQNQVFNDSLNSSIRIIINPEYMMTRLDKKLSSFCAFKFGLISENNEFGICVGKLIENNKFQSPIIKDFEYLVNFNILNFKIYYKRYTKIENKIDLFYGIGIGTGNVKLENTERELLPFTKGLQASDTYCLVDPEIGLKYDILKNLSANLSFGYMIYFGFNMTSSYYYHSDQYHLDFTNRKFNDFFMTVSLKFTIDFFK